MCNSNLSFRISVKLILTFVKNHKFCKPAEVILKFLETCEEGVSYFSMSKSPVKSILVSTKHKFGFFSKVIVFLFSYWPCPIRDSAAARVEWIHSTSKNLKSHPPRLNSSSGNFWLKLHCDCTRLRNVSLKSNSRNRISCILVIFKPLFEQCTFNMRVFDFVVERFRPKLSVPDICSHTKFYSELWQKNFKNWTWVFLIFLADNGILNFYLIFEHTKLYIHINSKIWF